MWPFNSTPEAVGIKLASRSKLVGLAAPYQTNEHDEYLRASSTVIVQNIQKGQWTASQVVEAYIARAAFAHSKTNCLTEIMFEDARQEAKRLDGEFASTKKLRGPLHGVPISVKDQFKVTGYDNTIGFTQWASKPALEDADVVALLRSAGAIIIAKGNVPQIMMAFECSNPLWGRTTNPYSEAHTPGGSTGGDSALLAMDGAVAAIGTDIGGSLRIPASYCGIYSLKPTAGRVSNYGGTGPAPGFEGVKVVTGPMARSVADVELFSRVLFGKQPSHQPIAPLPFREVELPSKLKFGYYTNDGMVHASPACRRAVLETVDALRRDGHECVEFEVPYVFEAFLVFAGLISADGYKTAFSHLGPDPVEDILFLTTLGPRLPWIIQKLGHWVASTLLKDPKFADSLAECKTRSFGGVMALTDRRDELTRLFHKDVWAKYGFDGIIAPVQSMPTLAHGDCKSLSPIAVATALYNLIESPVGIIPVTRVSPTKDALTPDFLESLKTGPIKGSPILETELFGTKHPKYNPDAMAGIPVGVQVVGQPWDDEKVLALMHVIDNALGERGFGPLAYNRVK